MNLPHASGLEPSTHSWWRRLLRSAVGNRPVGLVAERAGQGDIDGSGQDGELADLAAIGAVLPGTVMFQLVGLPGRRARLTFMSATVAQVNGLDAAQLLQDAGPWFSQVITVDRPVFRQAVARAIESMAAMRVDLRMRRVDGVIRWMHIAAMPRLLADGRVAWGGVQTDMTDQREDMLRTHETDAHWLTVLRNLPGGVTRFDTSLRIRFINEEHARWYGRSVADMLGRTLAEVLPPDRYARMEPHLLSALGGHKTVFENTIEVEPGDTRYRFNTIMPERGPDGRVSGLFAFVIDLTEGKQTELALAEKQAELRGLFEALPDMVFAKDAEGRYRACNRAFEAFFGCTEAGLLGQTDFDRTDLDTASRYRAEDLSAMQTGRAYRAEEILHGAAGDGTFDVIKLPVRDARGRISGVVGVARDVTDRKRSEQQIERLAFYDALTALPNRRLLVTRLESALRASELSLECGAVLFLDIDNFKDFNDILGHDMGDRLLQLVGERLTRTVPVQQTVARFSGDGFVVVCEHLGIDAGDATAAAEKVGELLLHAFAQPFAIGGRQHHATASVGIALFGAKALSVDELLKRADLAMHQAKASSRNALRFFDPQMQDALRKRAALEADLRAGMPRGELRLHYQPVVDGSGRMTGAEALVRWQHPERGLVPPLDFIPMAEETGLILPLGQWVLLAACRQLASWASRASTRDLTVAVNVSARQFRHPDFIDQVEAVLHATGADARKLKFELTETLLFHDVEGIIDKMERLQQQGIGFSLDDFGTGYSSLGYLKRLPLEQLKIDKSFVRDVLTDPHDAAIVRTTLTLALSLDLDVIAEGVETAGQRDFLRRHGCRSFQGYLFGRPLPIDEMEQQQGIAP